MKTATIDLSNAGPAAPILRAGYEAAHREGRMVWLYDGDGCTWSYTTPKKAAATIDRGEGEWIENLEFIR